MSMIRRLLAVGVIEPHLYLQVHALPSPSNLEKVMRTFIDVAFPFLKVIGREGGRREGGRVESLAE